MITKLLKNKMFHFNLEIVYSKKQKDFEKQFKLYKLDELHPNYTFNNHEAVVFYDERVDIGYLFLSTKKPTVIAHECLHIAMRVCNLCGIPININNDEVIAYMLGWYIGEINQIIKSG